MWAGLAKLDCGKEGRHQVAALLVSVLSVLQRLRTKVLLLEATSSHYVHEKLSY